MSIFTIMEALRRIHDAHGKLSEIAGHLQTFERAATFNPRDRDAWDIFDMRDERLTRITRVLRRVQRTTRQLDGATGGAPNRSRELSRLFGNWAQAYADHGEGSREVDRAQMAYAVVQYEWADEWQRENSRVETARRAMRRQRDFYSAQHQLFADLKRLATLVVRYGVTSAHQAQALAYMIQFEEISNSSRTIMRHYDSGLSSIGRWQRALQQAHVELNAWLIWSRNRRSVSRSLESQRAPR